MGFFEALGELSVDTHYPICIACLKIWLRSQSGPHSCSFLLPPLQSPPGFHTLTLSNKWLHFPKAFHLQIPLCADPPVHKPSTPINPLKGNEGDTEL